MQLKGKENLGLFQTDPSTQLTIAWFRDTFEAEGNIRKIRTRLSGGLQTSTRSTRKKKRLTQVQNSVPQTRLELGILKMSSNAFASAVIEKVNIFDLCDMFYSRISMMIIQNKEWSLVSGT